MSDGAQIRSGEHANGTGGGTPAGHGNQCDGDEHPPLSVAVELFGPDQATVDAAVSALLPHPSVRQALGANEHRLLDFRVEHREDPCAEQRVGAAKSVVGCPPDRFVALVYDYTANQVLEARGPLYALNARPRGRWRCACLAISRYRAAIEFAAAVDVVMHDRELCEQLRSGELAVYRPMPPVVDRQLPDGRVERTLTVGLRATSAEAPFHEVVGVSMFDRRVLRGKINGVVQPSAHVCEPPPGRDPYITGGGLSGQCWITVKSGGQTLWHFLAVRPGASSGTNGSGIELRYVDYRGKRVLYHAHVPILNVEYGADTGDPLRPDLSRLAECRDAVRGERCGGRARLSLSAARAHDHRQQHGRGQLCGRGDLCRRPGGRVRRRVQAGWYRYISEWRLHANGTMRPRFGFAGTQNPCTCHLHTHHVYWRLDFDIRTPGHNIVEEFNDPPIVGNNNWHTKQFEIRRVRDPLHKRKWRVRNIHSGEAYTIVPGPHDGVATPYGVGDLFVLRYHGGELDDRSGLHHGSELEPGAHRQVHVTARVGGGYRRRDLVRRPLRARCGRRSGQPGGAGPGAIRVVRRALVERGMRPLAIGRHNWLFVGRSGRWVSKCYGRRWRVRKRTQSANA